MTVQKRQSTVPPQALIDEVSEYTEIPPQLQEELDAMNQVWRAQAEEQAQRMEEPEEQPETDLMADYRVEILGKAAHIVSQDRNVAYGPPEDSFQTIAALWNAYLGGESLLTTDVAAMLALLKIARLATNPISEDSWVDLAGYAACGASSAKVLLATTQPDQ